MANTLKRAGRKLFTLFGYELVKCTEFDGSLNPCSDLLTHHEITDLERLASVSLTMPGMISPRSGQILYALCVMQSMSGAVVEVGSWQGRSTSFLARAVRDSGNGPFFAIDHFRGNVGKEKWYVVGKKDLTDLKSNFLSNMRRLGLDSTVNLLDMPNAEAAGNFHSDEIRFLFIDGDHTAEGVAADINLFFPKLRQGAIVVFDDFSPVFPGLLQVVDNLITTKPSVRCFSYKNTLVLHT